MASSSAVPVGVLAGQLAATKHQALHALWILHNSARSFLFQEVCLDHSSRPSPSPAREQLGDTV